MSRCFKEYQKLVKRKAGANERESLAQHICALLTVHATIEEEIFYPAARVVLDDEALMDEADVAMRRRGSPACCCSTVRGSASFSKGRRARCSIRCVASAPTRVIAMWSGCTSR